MIKFFDNHTVLQMIPNHLVTLKKPWGAGETSIFRLDT